jgi:hypothetical protein
VLAGWYPNSALEMDEGVRDEKAPSSGRPSSCTPGGRDARDATWFVAEVGARWPGARVLYWT